MKTIEEVGFSVGLYNKLKRSGINFIRDIKNVDYNKLTKAELIELLENYAEYRD